MLLNGRYELLEALPPGKLGLGFHVRDLDSPEHLLCLKAFPRGALSAEERTHFLQSCRRLGGTQESHLVVPQAVGLIETLIPRPQPPLSPMPPFPRSPLPETVRALPPLSTGWLYIVREYVVGRDLATALATLVAVRWSDLLAQACSALEALRARAEVHGRLHPGNLIVRGEAGGPLADPSAGADFALVDGGLADRVQWPPPPPPAPFAAPELARGAIPDHRSDLYSLAACFVVALPGVPPSAPLAVPEAHPDLTPEVARTLRRMLAPDPSARPASARECLEALRSDRVAGLPSGIEDLLPQPFLPPLRGREALLASAVHACTAEPVAATPGEPPGAGSATATAGFSGPSYEPTGAGGPPGPGLLLFRGALGSGRSRFLREVGAALWGRLRVLEARCHAPASSLSWLRALAATASPQPPGSGPAGHPRPSTAGLGEEAASLVDRLLAGIGERPTVLLLDDAHLLDEEGTEVVRWLATNPPATTLVPAGPATGTAAAAGAGTGAEAQPALLPRLRVAVSYARGRWATPAAERMVARLLRQGSLTVFDILGLNLADSGEILRQLLGLLEVPRAISQRLFQETRGFPLHLLQALALLAEERIFFRAHGRWQADVEDPRQLQVPDPMSAVVAGRLKHLPESGRRVLEHLARLGGPASVTALALGCGIPPEEVRDLLALLLRKGLAQRVSLLEYACASATLADALANPPALEAAASPSAALSAARNLASAPTPKIDLTLGSAAGASANTGTAAAAIAAASAAGAGAGASATSGTGIAPASPSSATPAAGATGASTFRLSEDRCTAFSAPPVPLDSTRRAPGRTETRLLGEQGLARMLEIHRALLAELNPKRLLDKIIDAVIALFGAERGFVILVQERRLEVKAARNFEESDIAKPEFEVSRTIAEQVLQSGRAVIAASAATDARFRKFASVSNLQLQSVLCAPLRYGERLIGCIYLDNRSESGAFRDHDLPVVENFCAAAALAVRNSFLHAEAVRKQQEAETANTGLKDRVARQETELAQARRSIDEREAKKDRAYRHEWILGRSEPLRKLFAALDPLAASTAPVLLLGESGTGKELVARALHVESTLRDRPFVTVNCAALSETLLESELFGHVRGAFTGADRDRDGLFVLADGGTLFLDEVGDMPPAMQVKLLRVLQDGELRPVGGGPVRHVKVRVLAATHCDLEERIRAGSFREDLFYRLAVVSVRLPALRERQEDIPILVEHFLRRIADEDHEPLRQVHAEALRRLMDFPWPGNVRQLENEVRRMATLGGRELTVADLSPAVRDHQPVAVSVVVEEDTELAPEAPRGAVTPADAPEPTTRIAPAAAVGAEPPAATGAAADAPGAGPTEFPPLEELNRRHIFAALERTRGNYGEAARLLGISYVTLWRKLKAYGVARKRDGGPS
ncbi:MAG: sigma 54-interacting transcriptional regulator [Planctomycetes bacterium]|nr:sigma 54-interacting transcriptional regulator [Planctomycetota bacterium]